MAETLFYAAYAATLGIVQDVAGDGYTVYDGPQVTYPDNQSFVAVGVDDIQPGVLDVSAIAAGVQDWESLGATARLETFLINLTLVAWDGMSEALSTCRDRSDTFVQAFGQALRPPPHGTGDAMLGNVLNQGGAGTGWCGLAVVGISQRRNSSGCAVVTRLALACTARV